MVLESRDGSDERRETFLYEVKIEKKKNDYIIIYYDSSFGLM